MPERIDLSERLMARPSTLTADEREAILARRDEIDEELARLQPESDVGEGGSRPPTQPPLGKEEHAAELVARVRYNASQMQVTDQDADMRAAYRRDAREAHRSLVALVGEQQALRMEHIAAALPNEPELLDDKDRPSLDYLYADFAQHPIPSSIDERTTIDPRSIPPDELQEIYRLRQHADDLLGDDDPDEILEDVVAGTTTVPSLDQWTQNSARLLRSQDQKTRDAKLRRRIVREQFKIKQDFARQQFDAQYELKEAEQKRRAGESAGREQRANVAAADEQADLLYKWQRTGRADERLEIRHQASMQDRAQRNLEHAEDRRTAAQKAIALADTRRKQLAADTALAATKLLTHTQVRLEALPTPGGIGLLLLTIVFILFAIQPANASGNTRLQLIWLAMMPWNQITLPYDTAAGSGNAPGLPGSGAPGSGPRIGLPGGFGLSTNAAAGGPGAYPMAGITVAPSAFDFSTELPYALQSQ
jgi:hypothetical protein